MSRQFEIIPFTGVDCIKFGMTPAQVRISAKEALINECTNKDYVLYDEFENFGVEYDNEKCSCINLYNFKSLKIDETVIYTNTLNTFLDRMQAIYKDHIDICHAKHEMIFLRP